jgi:2-amino-4-hydroxy-6-hydroxymethyldihydropteridine diphosphokinase
MGETEANPEELLKTCQQIETEMGRAKEHAKWSPRVIDIDILLYGDVTLQSKSLTIPHAELHNRAFSLLPLLELKPDYKHTKNLAENHGTKRIGHFA